jgi:hypothetical protein
LSGAAQSATAPNQVSADPVGLLSLPAAGAASVDQRRLGHQEWIAAARAAGTDLTGLDIDTPFEQRVAWALQRGLAIACVYTRYSSKHQDSTCDQIRANVVFAGRQRIYVPPELVCVDEAETGRQLRRDDLERVKRILQQKLATTLLVFKASRLFRQAYLGYQFIQQEVVEEGLRAVSVSQGIDTADRKMWKAQLQLHGLMDDLLLDTIADCVREGQIGLFKKRLVTGALGVGFRAEEVPGARPTRRGRPRAKIVVDEKAAELIRQHAAWLLQGMATREGVRRWRAACGPCDPRSTTGKMTYPAYLRLFTNERLTGRWEFGRRRNAWSSKRDYTRQVVQPDAEVTVLQCEDLRILADEVFYPLRAKLLDRKTGPRGPRTSKEAALCDLVTDVFICSQCRRRLHSCGDHGQSMHCPAPDCRAHTAVNRRKAVDAVCDRLRERLADDQTLIDYVVSATQRLDALGDEDIAQMIAVLELKVRDRTNRIDDLTDLAGEGSEADRAELKAKIRAAQIERATLQSELTKLRHTETRPPVKAEEVRQILADFQGLLTDGAAGRLGPEGVHRSAAVFRKLVGGKVEVIVEERPGRQRAVVRGRFTPQLLATAVESGDLQRVPAEIGSGEVEVWLRPPPRLDAIAPEVRRLYEEERLGFRAIARRLGIGCGNIYQSYHRYYAMQGLPVPACRPRGRPPKSA